jgi:hypothetical protein
VTLRQQLMTRSPQGDGSERVCTAFDALALGDVVFKAFPRKQGDSALAASSKGAVFMVKQISTAAADSIKVGVMHAMLLVSHPAWHPTQGQGEPSTLPIDFSWLSQMSVRLRACNCLGFGRPSSPAFDTSFAMSSSLLCRYAWATTCRAVPDIAWPCTGKAGLLSMLTLLRSCAPTGSLCTLTTPQQRRRAVGAAVCKQSLRAEGVELLRSG